MHVDRYKILVLTQKSVCLQFEEEIKEKLKIDSNVIYNVAYDTTNSLKKNIPTLILSLLAPFWFNMLNCFSKNIEIKKQLGF